MEGTRFWLALIALAPLLLLQARRTRRDTPRLPEAGGPDHGQAGDGPAPTRLLVVGESTAAGVGVQEHRQGLGAQLARALHARSGQPVAWQVKGVNGIRAGALAKQLAEAPPADVDRMDADLAVISLGVNDTTGLTRPGRYQADLRTLIEVLRRDHPTLPVALLSVPPMQHFTALPAPLRQVLGLRAARLDRTQRSLAARLENVHYLSYPAIADPALLAEDGYHPGERGYAYIADRVADTLAALLTRCR